MGEREGLLALTRHAFNVGLTAGMKEFTSTKGGNTWVETKPDIEARLDGILRHAQSRQAPNNLGDFTTELLAEFKEELTERQRKYIADQIGRAALRAPEAADAGAVVLWRSRSGKGFWSCHENKHPNPDIEQEPLYAKAPTAAGIAARTLPPADPFVEAMQIENAKWPVDVATMNRVFTDICDELGCAYDNEVALQAIADLKDASAGGAQAVAPGNCPFCGSDPFHRSEMGEPLAVVCCELGDSLFRGARPEPETVEIGWDDFTKIAGKLRAAAGHDAWYDDPSADERWQAGLDFGMGKLCQLLGVDSSKVSWDAATETLDGDVSAVLGNIMRAKYGDEWSAADAKGGAA